MGAENSPGIPNFSNETLSRSFVLERKFRESGAIGVKQDDESRARADVEASKILNTSFSVGNVAETQVNAVMNYDSVSHMIEIVNNNGNGGGGGLTDRVRENARNALYEVGLALSENKDVFKAATEGRLGEVLVPSLNGIEPYLLSSYLTKGRDDEEGQKNVADLVELFKLKKKAEARPDWYKADFDKKKKDLFDKLFDASDDAGEAEVRDGTVGRLELMMGYITEIDKDSSNPAVVETKGVDDKFAAAAEKLAQAAEKLSKSAENRGTDPEIKKMLEVVMGGRRKTGHKADFIPPEDFVPGSAFEEGAEAKYYSRYDITALALAVSMKVMDPDGARFDSYRPTEWYKNLPKEFQDVIDVMIEINGAAASTYYFGKDLEKLINSKRNFSFTTEKMRILFNDDFKLGMSKMLNDLCEQYTDQNGYSCLRYKEKFYKLTEYRLETVNGEQKKVPILGPGEATENGFLMKSVGTNPDGTIIYKRIEIPMTRDNEGKGALALDENVMAKLDFIEDYKDEIALFLAGQHGDEGFVRYDEDKDGHKKGEFILNEKGERLPKPIYQMYAYTAWNLWYGMGDSSVADRMRMLPTWDKIVSDAIRTLNPEHKAMGKMMIFKTGKPRGADDLVEAEYFSGEIGDYVISMMGIEDSIGPIDGEKTMRQKILDGEVELFPDKMLYGFLDFFNGGRDLVKPETVNGKEVKYYDKDNGRDDKVTLAQLLMDYGYKTVSGPNGKVDGVFDAANKRDFNFKRNQTTFMNEFRDSYEAAVLVNQAITGKLEAKDPAKWARQLKSAFGMASQIWFNGKRVLNNYTTSPWLWRAMIIGTFGADKSRFSSDYIPLKVPESKIKDYTPPYSFAVHDLISSFGLSGVDIMRLQQLLGVDIRRGEHLRGAVPRIRTEALVERDKNRTRKILSRLNKKAKDDEGVFREDYDQIVSRINSVYATDYDFSMLKRAYERAVSSGKSELTKTLVEKMEKQFRVS